MQTGPGFRVGSAVRAALRDERLTTIGDALVATLLAGTSVAAVLNGGSAFGSPRTAALVLALCSTAPVAVRRRWPIPVAAVLLFANGVELAAAAPHEGALQPYIALVLAGYSVGSRAEGRFSITLPAGLAILAAPVFALGLADHQSLGNEITSYVWLVAAWGVGRVVRGMRRKTRELEAVNAELAEHREVVAEAAVAVERGRIAREIHDVIAHNVSMMVVQAGAAARVLEADEPRVRSALDTIAETGRQTVDEMRSLLGILRAGDDETADRAPQPGLADLGSLADGLRRSGVQVQWRVEGAPRRLPRSLDLSAYRIVQEALTNSLKHAQGSCAEVVVRYAEASLELDIRDSGGAGNGERLVPRTAGGGHGIVGMRERAALFGGELTAVPTADGFRVTARLPLPLGVGQ
ncbi:MAG TPA: histidine kinase [Nocardioides sp.]|jgi:signal transduction histidine kinase|nr:histidine kinase [Nocardioides sp.]